ncbi:hypothetical protein CRM73_00100 [Kocuria sp. CCUG 69068]|uniref:hypothetical protein n=1 Tax=Kocuria sp. CCUG 69068 TaxID=2043138 RepID=UPI001E500DE9|nr:hypothetical protein [Kocuria sp. CCUG 69068]
MLFRYAGVIAINPNTDQTEIVRSATGTVHLDENWETPIEVHDVNGFAMTTLNTTVEGLFPDFYVEDQPVVGFQTSSGHRFYLRSSTPVPGPSGPAPVAVGASAGAFTFEYPDGTIVGGPLIPTAEALADARIAELLDDGVSASSMAVQGRVAEAVAADGTVAQAAAAAVDQELSTRDILEGGNIDQDDLAFAMVDDNGARLWLEANMQGRPTEWTKSILIEDIAPAAAEATGLTDMRTDITGLSLAVVDEDGRQLEWEFDETGRVSDRVLAAWAARMNIPTPEAAADPTTIVAPSSVPLLVGRESRIYYDSVIGARDPSHTVLTFSGGNGSNLGTHWSYTPDVAKSFTLEIRVVDRTGATVRSRSIPVQTYAAPAGTGRRHLAIGDSITRAGDYVRSAVTAFAGAATVGTRTYNDGALATEGRGGWSLNGYFDNIGHESWGDSPFLFPANVSGAKFWGNTQFWKRVCYEDPTGYDYAGFQKMARGWGPSNAPFLYGTDGYPLAPAEGDVVVDPTYAEADEFRQYTGGAWTAIARPAVEFSFPKYMERYAAAYPNGGPTSISIMLETNDFFNGIDNAKFTTWKTRMDTVIASVRAWSATVPFVILLAPTGGPWDKWTGQTVNKWEFDQRMKEAATRIIAAYDTTAARTNRVYVASSLGAVAEANLSDWVHPSAPAGHEQLGTPLAGMLARLITEGVA